MAWLTTHTMCTWLQLIAVSLCVKLLMASERAGMSRTHNMGSSQAYVHGNDAKRFVSPLKFACIR